MPTKDSTGMVGMTDTETVAHLRGWANSVGSHSVWAWPTDACGYNQHIRFVKHRNENWHGGDFNQFVRDYADTLEASTFEE
jgi:hypothetical protein